MKGLKKAILIFMAAIMFVTATGCSKGGMQGNKIIPKDKLDLNGVTLKVYGFRDFQTDVGYTDYNVGIQKFKEAYPGVIIETKKAGGYGMGTDLITAVASGDPWDLQYVFAFQLKSAVLKGLYTPLDDYIDWKDPYYDKEFLENFKYKGQYYGISNRQNQEYDFMIYDPNKFLEAGFKTPLQYYKEGKWNFDTVLEMAPKLTKDANQDGINDQIMISSYWTGRNNAAMFGATYINILDDGKLKLNFDTQGTRDYLNFLYKLSYEMKSLEIDFTLKPKAATLLNSMNTNGFSDEDRVKKLNNKELEIVPYPTNDGKMVPTMNGSTFAVPAGSKNVQAAMVLAQYMTDVRKEKYNACYDKVTNTDVKGLADEMVKQAKQYWNQWPDITDPFTGEDVMQTIKFGKPVSTYMSEVNEKMKAQVDTFNSVNFSK